MLNRAMSNRRDTVRQKAKIGGKHIYVDVGLYADGTIGEIFIVVEKTGDNNRWLYDEVARLASKLIQHGCPVETVMESWLGTKGKPAGPVQGDTHIKNCTSILDYVARTILVSYCGRDDLAHVKAPEVL